MNKKLKELNGRFEDHGGYTHIGFDCPACGTHRIEVPLPPHPKAWKQTGTTLEDLSLTPSVRHETGDADFFSPNADNDDHVPRPCFTHFYITNGEIINC